MKTLGYKAKVFYFVMGDKLKIKEIPVVLRPREKAMEQGFDKLSDRELLAIYIRQGTKGKSALEVADAVLKRAGSINGLMDLTQRDLLNIKGISYVKATEILGLAEVGRRLIKPQRNDLIQIEYPENLVNWLNLEIGYKKQEYFMAVYLNKQNQVLNYSHLFVGTLDRSVVHPREIFKEAVRLSAAHIILVHNHPSGGMEPSLADVETTKALVEVGFMMGVYVLDHIIVSHGDYVSIRQKSPELFNVE